MSTRIYLTSPLDNTELDDTSILSVYTPSHPCLPLTQSPETRMRVPLSPPWYLNLGMSFTRSFLQFIYNPSYLELEWTSQRSPSPHSFWNLVACWSESPISWLIQILYSGKSPSFFYYLHWHSSFLSAENFDDPEERFIRVLQYYLAGWHIKPKGVKKPWVTDQQFSCQLSLARSYNPVLGEFFRCRYDYPDGTNGFYIAEQGLSPRPSVIRDNLINIPLQYRIIHPCRSSFISPRQTMSAFSVNSVRNQSF
jgi:hypothetical protein